MGAVHERLIDIGIGVQCLKAVWPIDEHYNMGERRVYLQRWKTLNALRWGYFGGNRAALV